MLYAYIELTPYDLVKYEIDKTTGYVRVDRPQKTSSQPPSLYGFVPRTFCGERVRALCPGAERGDGDPLDICVISERPVTRGEVLLDARVVGGLQMIDHGEADDKIIAVLAGDEVWGEASDLGDIPQPFIERLRHYFLTYKLVPDGSSRVSIDEVYGADHAQKVVTASIEDYDDEYGG